MCGFKLQDDCGCEQGGSEGHGLGSDTRGLQPSPDAYRQVTLGSRPICLSLTSPTKMENHHLPAGLLSELNKMMSVAHKVQDQTGGK